MWLYDLVKYCRPCRSVYPDSYNYCPNHGSRFVSREWYTTQNCPACGRLAEKTDAFCAQCGMDLKQQAHGSGTASAEAPVAQPSSIQAETTEPFHPQSLFTDSATIDRSTVFDRTTVFPGRSTVPPPFKNDYVARSGFGPGSGQKPAAQARSVADSDGETFPPRRTVEKKDYCRDDGVRLPPPRRNAKGGIAKIVGLALLVGLGLAAVWELYGTHNPITQALLQRSIFKREPALPLPRGEAPSPVGSASVTDPATQVPQVDPQNGKRFQDRNQANRQPTDLVLPDKKNLPASEAFEPAGVQSKAIQSQIDRAILQRAVAGVNVAFINETAYLTGAVLSERQKNAAEEAARNVPGVKRVRSSIAVIWENS